MLETWILLIISGAFAAIFTVLHRVIHRRLQKDSVKLPAVFVCPIQGHREDAEFLLRGLSAEIRGWHRNPVTAVLADCGMDPETRRIAELFVRDHPEISLCQEEELTEWIHKACD